DRKHIGRDLSPVLPPDLHQHGRHIVRIKDAVPDEEHTSRLRSRRIDRNARKQHHSPRCNTAPPSPTKHARHPHLHPASRRSTNRTARLTAANVVATVLAARHSVPSNDSRTR